MAASADDPPFRAALVERNRAVNEWIGTHVAEIADRSGVTFPYPFETLALACGGMLRGLLLQRLLDPENFPPGLIEDAFAAFVTGLARPRDPSVAARPGVASIEEDPT